MMKFNFKQKELSARINFRLLRRYASVLLWFHDIPIDTRPLYMDFISRVEILWNSNGKGFVITYLKECHRLLQFYIAGNPSVNGTNLRIGSAFGLPCILPKRLRVILSRLDSGSDIRVTLALLSLFRVIDTPGVMKLETITKPFTGLAPTLPSVELSLLFHSLFDSYVNRTKPTHGATLLPTKTAGPNSKRSFLGTPLDAIFIATKAPQLLRRFQVLSEFFVNDIYSLLIKEIDFVSSFANLEIIEKVRGRELRIGKLSKKFEPAGKVRVFAIVDNWTQSCLKPIHDHIFSILRLIPQDGTFDQGAPIRRLRNLLKTKPDKTVYSYDLSAATDRVPIELQKQVLSLIYNNAVSEAWGELLVDRDYVLDGSKYRYSVGQPMGALSSWGVFALTHHVLLQFAARRAGHNQWFSDYAILGDDICIADKTVADSYFLIMTTLLGVEINISKSLVSDRGVMEFAKRLVTPDCEYSPLGAKNIILCLKDRIYLPSLFLDAVVKGELITKEIAENLLVKLKPDLIRLNAKEKVYMLWTMLRPFGFIKNGVAFTSSKMERSLAHLGTRLVVTAVEDEIYEGWLTDFDLCVEKSMTELRSLSSANVLVGEVMIPIRSLPSYSSYFKEAVFSVCDLLDMRPVERPFDYERSWKALDVAAYIKEVLDRVPVLIPTENWLMLTKTKKPSLRNVNFRFFKKVVLRVKAADPLLDPRYYF